ncbi:lipopolysaccharide biosynthesis protein [Steroidobacter cummioxidans]|uniref:lipopolysaccharide biosynthesis protein n=1 Tax=Steroidobacter cummioxidans TaxID=1803913 RepID=UPI000E319D37|nr:lipopolysaccharide biosynthesis protein [Steroidobacter cummioxidans]
MLSKLSTRAGELFGFLNRTDGSLRSKILRSGFWQALATIGVNGLTFAKSAVLARLLVPEAFGLMSLSLMAIRGAQLITETGFGNAMVQRQGDWDSAKDTAFTLLALRGLLLALLMVPVGYGMSAFYGKSELVPLIGVLGVSFLFSGMANINLMRTIRELDFKKVAVIENVVGLASFVIAIAIAWWTRSVWALVASFVAAAAIKTTMSYFLIPGRPVFHIDRKVALELLHYGKFITAATILMFIASEAGGAVIGKMLDVTQLGHYSVAFLLANFPPTHVAFVLSNIMFPAYSKIQNDLPVLRKTFAQVTDVIASLVMPVMAGMAAAADTMIGAFYGAGWENAVGPFRILCIYGALHAIVTVNGYMFNGIGRPDIGFRIAVIRVVCILVLIVPAIQLGGTVGAAAAMSFVMVLNLLYGLYQVTKVMGAGKLEVLRPLLPALVKSIAAGAAIWLGDQFLPDSKIKILWLILIGAAVYIPMNVGMIKTVLKLKK